MVTQQQSSFRELWALPLNLSAIGKQPRSMPLLLATSAVPLPRPHTVLPPPLHQPQSDKLELVQLSDWEEGRPYDEDPPVYLH
jgi:hypothetical protein